MHQTDGARVRPTQLELFPEIQRLTYGDMLRAGVVHPQQLELPLANRR